MIIISLIKSYMFSNTVYNITNNITVIFVKEMKRVGRWHES